MSARFAHTLPWGTEITDDGARFRLWAPAQDTVSLVAETGATVPMTKSAEGWFEAHTDAIPIGGGYHFALQDGMCVPDAAARAQMSDVHGFSRLVDPKAYEWQTPDWQGRPWQEAVIYELHTGTFSQEGTFDGIARDLDRLVDTGVTAIELLPVAQFGGNRGWGYDGVLLYTPHAAYGGPEGLKRLVDACHERGLMVLMDVVYNHFGPDGNYLSHYAPNFFDPQRNTPWGAAIAFDRPQVREFFVHNALYWLQEFRCDGLRFDAVDHIKDTAEEEVLAEIAREIRTRIPDRHIHLSIEDDENSIRLFQFDETGAPRLYDAEWNDDWHHAVHVILTGEKTGYYKDHIDDPVGRSRGRWPKATTTRARIRHSAGKMRGEPSAHLPPTVFINYVQNHDQTGNRAHGDRLVSLAPAEAVDAALTLLLLAPHIPMLFMGDEYGETKPFLFFTDFQGDLAKAVVKGRRADFGSHESYANAAAGKEIPNPNALETFERSVLAPADTPRLDLVKRLLAARKAHVIPHMTSIGGHAGTVAARQGPAFTVSWDLDDGGTLALTANLSDAPVTLPSTPVANRFSRPLLA
ncbi:malto-oligosyltrehalose trehalohydrolase [Methyloceanibacter stevinii]|uniref:malto-oligosyltrehalose trehalohydrolase n=1 Tax=Methyloceanibacter stevinii TaxID=1774970 RepID=UPI000AE28AA8|nr:malto-oligosyltrehalose trehalohydrolase [Methyloceanibacter stevinii]